VKEILRSGNGEASEVHSGSSPIWRLPSRCFAGKFSSFLVKNCYRLTGWASAGGQNGNFHPHPGNWV